MAQTYVRRGDIMLGMKSQTRKYLRLLNGAAPLLHETHPQRARRCPLGRTLVRQVIRYLSVIYITFIISAIIS